MTELTKINISKARLAQLQTLAKQRAISTSALLEELVRAEWARTQQEVIAPLGYRVELREQPKPNGGPTEFIVIGGDDIGDVPLTIWQAGELARDAASVLIGKRTFTTVVATHSDRLLMLDIHKQGRGFVISIIRDQGENQQKHSKAISGPLLKDLIAAIVDRVSRAKTENREPAR
jgi:hypothetical protein